MPMLRLCGGVRVMSAFDTITAPESANSKPAAMRRAVVLPQPDGPSSEMSSPCLTSRSSLSSATVGPNVLRTETKLRLLMRDRWCLS
jgi:hypothetical protein